MVLDERYGGLEGLDSLCLVFNDYFLVLFVLRDILSNNGIRTQPERQRHDEADTDLANNLVPALQAIFVLLENLDIVIHETEESKP